MCSCRSRHALASPGISRYPLPAPSRPHDPLPSVPPAHCRCPARITRRSLGTPRGDAGLPRQYPGVSRDRGSFPPASVNNSFSFAKPTSSACPGELLERKDKRGRSGSWFSALLSRYGPQEPRWLRVEDCQAKERPNLASSAHGDPDIPHTIISQCGQRSLRAFPGGAGTQEPSPAGWMGRGMPLLSSAAVVRVDTRIAP